MSHKSNVFTTKVFYADGKPFELCLIGNPKRPEAAQHRIEFPGGAVEVSRLSDGTGYWAHIVINNGFWAFADNDCDGISKALGEIVASRIYCTEGIECVKPIPDQNTVHQIAVLIKSPSH